MIAFEIFTGAILTAEVGNRFLKGAGSGGRSGELRAVGITIERSSE